MFLVLVVVDIDILEPSGERHFPQALDITLVNLAHFVSLPSLNRVQKTSKMAWHNEVLIMAHAEIVVSLEE